MKLDVTGLKKQAQKLLTEAQNLLAPYTTADAQIPNEIVEKSQQLVGQADEIKEKIRLFNRITNRDELDDIDEFEEKADLPASAASWRMAAPNEGLSLIHISEPTRLLSISYAVFCLKK